MLKWDSALGLPTRGDSNRRPVFYRVQSFFKNTLQPIAPLLMQLHSTAVGRWQGTPIDFIQGARDSSGASDNLLHFGTFQVQNNPNDRYFIVVNRHCLPSESIAPTVTIGELQRPVGLVDMVTGETLFGNPGSPGLMYFRIPLAPGGGRLLKLVECATRWLRLADMPLGPINKRVKDGGCLAFMPQSGFLYGLKGNNRVEFYRYDPTSNQWATEESIPAIGSSGRKKAVKKGGAMAQVGGKVYAAKGNNTLDFWRYNPDVGHWTQLADVPTGGGKTVKEGAGAAGVTVNGTGYVYLLKGSGTDEFYCYNTVTDAWETKASAPYGASGKPFKHGSCLAGNGADRLYALKGSYNEFFAYDIAGNSWSTKTSLPLVGISGKKKKVKDGAGLTSFGGRVYALKGDNTLEFWQYRTDSDHWAQKLDMPVGGGKKVKGGGAIAGAGDHFYALKGNNTFEFYSCHPYDQVLPPGDFVSTLTGGEVLIAAGAGVFRPGWNPGSDSVVFLKDTVGRSEILKASMNGGAATQVAAIENADVSQVVWSPLGNKIACLVSDATHCSQLGISPASGGTPVLLTDPDYDCADICWSLLGDRLCYARESDSGYVEVFERDTTASGTEVMISASPYEHSHPVYQTGDRIVCVRGTDEGWDEVFALTHDSMGWTETQLTSIARDHSCSVAASGIKGLIAFEVDDNGFTQIGCVDSTGQERILTNGEEHTEPSILADGHRIHAVHHSGQGSSICRIDPATGVWQDEVGNQGERANPSAARNDSLSIITSAYELEGEGIYRTIGERTIFDPIARVEINPGSPPPPGFMKATDLPMAVLHCEVHDSLMHAPDSLLIWQGFSLSLADTAPVVDSFNWTAYRPDRIWPLDRGAGKYVLRLQFRYLRPTGPRDTAAADSIIADWSSPRGEVTINHRARMTNSPQCSLSVTASDSGISGLARGRFANRALVNLLQNSDFTLQTSPWVGNHYVWHDSLGLIELPMVADSGLWFYQDIPIETLFCYLCPLARLRLSADVLSESLWGDGHLEFQYRLRKFDTTAMGPDSLWMPAGETPIPQGYQARVGACNLRTDFDFRPQPPPGYNLVGARVRFFFRWPQNNAGRLWLDNVQLGAIGGPGYEGSDWRPLDTLTMWNLPSCAGEQVVYGQVQDRAGNESGIPLSARNTVQDSILLDNQTPIAQIYFPGEGQIIADSLISILGLAFDPAVPPGLRLFHHYKLTWGKYQAGYDSCFGILPESLFYVEMRPSTTSPWRTLANWNTRAITDQYGYGFYRLILAVYDSAGNQNSSTVTVKLDSSGNSLDAMAGGTSASALSVTSTP
jgi:hypothetical protein